jgi:FtsZ-binding cell division protein ZapB
MLEQFKEMFPAKLLTNNQMIASKRDKGIQYNANIRVNGVRGAYIGVKLKIAAEPTKKSYFGPKDPEYDVNVKKADQSVNIKELYEKEISELKEELNSTKSNYESEIESLKREIALLRKASTVKDYYIATDPVRGEDRIMLDLPEGTDYKSLDYKGIFNHATGGWYTVKENEKALLEFKRLPVQLSQKQIDFVNM